MSSTANGVQPEHDQISTLPADQAGTSPTLEDQVPHALGKDVPPVPPMPTAPKDFPAAIEKNKLFVLEVTGYLADMKEMIADRTANYSRQVRGSKATLNDADKAALADLVATDPFIQDCEQKIREFTPVLSKWEARRARLNSEFEFLVIEYKHQLRMKQIRAELQAGKEEIDYMANRNRR
jgi:hypothetical protein